MTLVETQLKSLMLRGLDGDASAQRQLLSDLSGLLRAFFARRLGRDDGYVEDLVQEALLAVHMRRETFDRSALFTSWAYAIARYKLIDHYRKSRIRSWAPLEAADELFARDEGGEAMAVRDVRVLLEHLPKGQRDAIASTRLQGLSTEEAAAATGQSPSAVKVNVHRGLQRLMARVRGDHGH